MKQNTQHGFTLLELIITIVIVSLLLTATLPSFQRYSTRASVLDGRYKLIEVMQLQNHYFSKHASYTVDLVGDLQLDKLQSDKGDYRIVAAPCNRDIALCVKLSALPMREGLMPLTLDSFGNASPENLW